MSSGPSPFQGEGPDVIAGDYSAIEQLLAGWSTSQMPSPRFQGERRFGSRSYLDIGQPRCFVSYGAQ